MDLSLSRPMLIIRRKLLYGGQLFRKSAGAESVYLRGERPGELQRSISKAWNHPFKDGSGRVGRLIALKECLHFGIIPFIIEDAKKIYYYRGSPNGRKAIRQTPVWMDKIPSEN